MSCDLVRLDDEDLARSGIRFIAAVVPAMDSPTTSTEDGSVMTPLATPYWPSRPYTLVLAKPTHGSRLPSTHGSKS